MPYVLACLLIITGDIRLLQLIPKFLHDRTAEHMVAIAKQARLENQWESFYYSNIENLKTRVEIYHHIFQQEVFLPFSTCEALMPSTEYSYNMREFWRQASIIAGQNASLYSSTTQAYWHFASARADANRRAKLWGLVADAANTINSPRSRRNAIDDLVTEIGVDGILLGRWAE